MKLALACDTMLGRKVAERLAGAARTALFAKEVAVPHEADLFVSNLECAISDRGARFPRKPFFFGAHPIAVDVLRHLGVGCVTLANNHALYYGTTTLLDTLRHLDFRRACAALGTDVTEAGGRLIIEWRSEATPGNRAGGETSSDPIRAGR